MGESKETAAAELYKNAAHSVMRSDYGSVARHIVTVCGVNNFKEELWQDRAMDGGRNMMHCDSFYQYLFAPMREGLGIESPALLDGILSNLGTIGHQALAKVSEKIDDWGERVRETREDNTLSLGRPPILGFNQHSEGYDNVIPSSQQGNGKDYTLRRLMRDHPELLERVKSGELSANAAAIEAGFREKTITVTLDPTKAAKAILKHFTAGQVAELRELIK